jgi:hypothetical protein
VAVGVEQVAVDGSSRFRRVCACIWRTFCLQEGSAWRASCLQVCCMLLLAGQLHANTDMTLLAGKPQHGLEAACRNAAHCCIAGQLDANTHTHQVKV